MPSYSTHLGICLFPDMKRKRRRTDDRRGAPDRKWEDGFCNVMSTCNTRRSIDGQCRGAKACNSFLDAVMRTMPCSGPEILLPPVLAMGYSKRSGTPWYTLSTNGIRCFFLPNDSGLSVTEQYRLLLYGNLYSGEHLPVKSHDQPCSCISPCIPFGYE